VLECLFPPGPARPVAEILAELTPGTREDRPFTSVNMVATVDGRAGLGGSSAALGDEADLEMLLELRALADAVLIGTGTLAAEGYDRLVRSPERRARRLAAGRAEDPFAVLISRSGRIPWDAGLFAAAEQPVLVYTSAGVSPPEVAAPVELVRIDDVSPAAVLADLHRRGVCSLVCEGGPTMNRSLLAAGLVDELFLTVAPKLAGGEPAGGEALRILAGGELDPALELELLAVLREGSSLFLRYCVSARERVSRATIESSSLAR
jgi:riboflavin-specific deaminase-like protein